MPEKSAVSGELWRTGLVPGAQSWGYLLISCSALLAVWALFGALACARPHPRRYWPMNDLLLSVGVGSMILLALVLAELTASAQFDMASYAHSDWGAWLGVSLAVVCTSGAWLAWASWKFPHLWSVDLLAD